MKASFLFPYKFKKIGWFIFIPSLFLGICTLAFENFPELTFGEIYYLFFREKIVDLSCFYELRNSNIIATLIAILIIIGGTFVGFSKMKTEDEFITQMRLNSLVLAVCINNLILVLCLIFVWGFPFLNIMVYNMFTVMFIFIIIFYAKLLKAKKTAKYEK